MRCIFAPAKQNNTDVFKCKATFLKALRNKFKKVFKKLFRNKKGCMFAAAKKVDNIIATIDVNGQQIDGSTAQVLNSGDWGAKWEAFGWTGLSMNGNDVDDIMKTMQDAKSKSGQGKPVVILMKTEMGNGVDFMMHSHKWHGVAPNDEQLASALSQNEATLGDY